MSESRVKAGDRTPHPEWEGTTNYTAKGGRLEGPSVQLGFHGAPSRKEKWACGSGMRVEAISHRGSTVAGSCSASRLCSSLSLFSLLLLTSASSAAFVHISVCLCLCWNVTALAYMAVHIRHQPHNVCLNLTFLGQTSD